MTSKQFIVLILFLLNFSHVNSQENTIDHGKIKEDLDEIITGLSQYYTYLEEKGVDLNCIREYYEQQIPNIKSEEQTVLFFEYLMNEFYDSHLNLTTNRDSSFRLFSPIYSTVENGKPIISNIWRTQTENLQQNLNGAEILEINGTDFNKAIQQFPSHCNDKNSEKVREWIVNKIVAGRYDQPRVLTLKLPNDTIIEFDLDELIIKQNSELLTSRTKYGMGIIRINN